MNESYCNQANDSVPFTTLAAEIGIFLPAIAEPIVFAAILRASTEFLTVTRAFKEDIKIIFEPGVCDYPLESSGCTTVLGVDWVEVNGVGITDYKINSDEWLVLPDRLSSFSCNTVVVAGTYLGLSENGCELPRNIYMKYGKGIIHNVLGQLYGMHGEDWYNPEMVRFYGGLGNKALIDAGNQVILSEGNDEIEVEGLELIL